MISTDHMGISHVNGSGHNVRVFHEEVISMVREALLVMCAVPSSSVAGVEKCALCEV